jgi:hypothetical protein
VGGDHVEGWRSGAAKAAWELAHYMVRVTWKILHDAVDYVPRDASALDRRAVMRRANRVAADLRRLGFALTITPLVYGAAG